MISLRNVKRSSAFDFVGAKPRDEVCHVDACGYRGSRRLRRGRRAGRDSRRDRGVRSTRSPIARVAAVSGWLTAGRNRKLRRELSFRKQGR